MNRSSELLNTVFWFLMDALWVFEQLNLAMAFIVPTVLTALVMVFTSHGFCNKMSDAACLCWVMMNSFWLLSDTYLPDTYLLLAKVSFVVGALSLFLALSLSKNPVDTLQRFKRLKLIKQR